MILKIVSAHIYKAGTSISEIPVVVHCEYHEWKTAFYGNGSSWPSKMSRIVLSGLARRLVLYDIRMFVENISKLGIEAKLYCTRLVWEDELIRMWPENA